MRKINSSKGKRAPRKYSVLVYQDNGYKPLPWGYTILETAATEARANRPALVVLKSDGIKIGSDGYVDLSSVTIVERMDPIIEERYTYET